MANSLIRQNVADFIEMLAPKTNADHTVDMDRLDYGFFGDHRTIRPYNSIEEGIIWYASRPEIQCLPESMILPLVAHNFGISVEEASEALVGELPSIVELN